MKRLQINYVIDKAHVIVQTFRVCLPEFAYSTVDDWLQRERDNWQEAVDLQLGWDAIDFGRGDSNQTGLILPMMRNDALGSMAYPKPYAEKMLQIQQSQQTPQHFHTHRTEDILNRGGGDLCTQSAWVNGANLCDDQRVITVSADGQRCTVKPGETLVLKPGQGICPPPHLYHHSWAEKALVLGWEVSVVNDDQHGNYFLGPGRRFPAIEEDEPVKWLLCDEYGILR